MGTMNDEEIDRLYRYNERLVSENNRLWTVLNKIENIIGGSTLITDVPDWESIPDKIVILCNESALFQENQKLLSELQWAHEELGKYRFKEREIEIQS